MKNACLCAMALGGIYPVDDSLHNVDKHLTTKFDVFKIYRCCGLYVVSG